MEIAVADNKKDVIKPLLRYGSLGIEMGLCVVIGIIIGQYLDKVFDTKPYLTIIFLLFGIAAAFKSIIVLIKKAEKDNEGNDDNRN
jgi:ATP synthase protein I